MDRISTTELESWQRLGLPFSLIDVRRAGVRQQQAGQLEGAHWLDPEMLLTWKDEIARDRPAILYCAKGHEIGQGAAATLRAMGLDARYLIDGFEGWTRAGKPVRSL